MLCVFRWNFDEGMIKHFELVQNGAVNAAALYYSEQLEDCVYADLSSRYHPVMISRIHALLMQHENAPPALEHCCCSHQNKNQGTGIRN